MVVLYALFAISFIVNIFIILFFLYERGCMKSTLKEYKMLIIRQVSEDNPDYIRSVKDTYGFFVRTMTSNEAWEATIKLHGIDKLNTL